MSRTKVKKKKPNKRKLMQLQREAYKQQLQRRQAMIDLMQKSARDSLGNNEQDGTNDDTSGADSRD
jgi:hypothetical protein